LDIKPEAGRDVVGPRRDKGHRYLRFETQAGRRGDDGSITPTAAGGLSPGVANGFGFGVAVAAEGDVLVLSPRDPADVRTKVAVNLDKQVPRWSKGQGEGGGSRTTRENTCNDD
ncbi:unnamed protein product, partial [Ectocarpus sp. 12 AP-2014]